MHRSNNWNHFLESLVHILVSPTVGYQLLVSQALIQLLESFSGISLVHILVSPTVGYQPLVSPAHDSNRIIHWITPRRAAPEHVVQLGPRFV